MPPLLSNPNPNDEAFDYAQFQYLVGAHKADRFLFSQVCAYEAGLGHVVVAKQVSYELQVEFAG